MQRLAVPFRVWNSFAFNLFLIFGYYMNGIIHFTAQFCLVIALCYISKYKHQLGIGPLSWTFSERFFCCISREQIHRLASQLLCVLFLCKYVCKKMWINVFYFENFCSQRFALKICWSCMLEIFSKIQAWFMNFLMQCASQILVWILCKHPW